MKRDDVLFALSGAISYLETLVSVHDETGSSVIVDASMIDIARGHLNTLRPVKSDVMTDIRYYPDEDEDDEDRPF